ncbi:TetR/AcrR family transcriptional regulator [Haliea sp. E17]|uniref:TetR/AcrR family transcriptional regulator n=1 Tax=Haliea sp. E17 TaxID=3401576 RepID=UPI003AAD1B85
MAERSPAPGSTRRPRNPEATREAILAAARKVLASDGPDGLSLSKVAHVAGVNRGTAYQHFETREELIKATVQSVSEHLLTRVFGSIDPAGYPSDSNQRPIYEVISGLVDFAVENPDLGRIWLFEILAADDPGEDVFFQRFVAASQGLADSEVSEDGIDAEALSVLILAGYFLWPVWVRARAHNKQDRLAMAGRMRREVLRLMLHGVMRAEAFPHLERLLEDGTLLDRITAGESVPLADSQPA